MFDGGAIRNWNQCFDENSQLPQTLLSDIVAKAEIVLSIASNGSTIIIIVNSFILGGGSILYCAIASRDKRVGSICVDIIDNRKLPSPSRLFEDHWQLIKKY